MRIGGHIVIDRIFEEYGIPQLLNKQFNAKVDVGSPILNYSIAYDTNNAKPLFYEAYCGSIADISQLEFSFP